MDTGIAENAIDQVRQKQCAMPIARFNNRYPFDERDVIGGIPIADHDETDCPGFNLSDEISVTAVSQRGAMFFFAPAPDQVLVSGPPLGRHDERDVSGRTAAKLE